MDCIGDADIHSCRDAAVWTPADRSSGAATSNLCTADVDASTFGYGVAHAAATDEYAASFKHTNAAAADQHACTADFNAETVQHSNVDACAADE
jgi:hypothetical protein